MLFSRDYGGAPVNLCDAPNGRGGAWAEDDTIIFTPTNSPLAPDAALQPLRRFLLHIGSAPRSRGRQVQTELSVEILQRQSGQTLPVRAFLEGSRRLAIEERRREGFHGQDQALRSRSQGHSHHDTASNPWIIPSLDAAVVDDQFHRRLAHEHGAVKAAAP